MTTDSLTSALGRPGKFQVFMYLYLSANWIYICWNHLGMAYIGARTKHHCSVQNSTEVSTLVPWVEKNGRKQWDGCHLYAGYNTTKKVACPNGWTYALPQGEQTIISEWDLVCGDAYKVNLATTIYFVGVMVGGLVFGTLSDKFGRRPVILVTMFIPPVIGLLLFFLKNYVAFLVLRFFLGFVLQGLQMVTFTTLVELFATEYRTYSGIGIGFPWSLGMMTLALFSYLLKDWHYIQLLATMVGLFQVGLVCCLPESIRWLLVNKRYEEADKVVHRIAAFNKMPFPKDIFDETKDELEGKQASEAAMRSYTILAIFRSNVLRKRSLAMMVVWFSTSLGYYGLSLNVSSLAGNKYLNFFISGMLESVIIIFNIFVLTRFGRRKPLFVYSLIAGLFLIVAGVIPNTSNENLQNLVTALALMGRMLITGNFGNIFIYTSELYPTMMRNVALGSGIFWARIGSIVAPQILLLGQYTADSVPFIIFGGLVLLSGGLALFLPETLHVKLPETMEEARKFEKNNGVEREETNTQNEKLEMVTEK